MSEQVHLQGKPHPEISLLVCTELGARDPQRAMMVENAVAGVEAGRAGGFGFVPGASRGGNEHDLYKNDPDWVINNFAEVSIGRLQQMIAQAHAKRTPQ